MLGEKDCVCLSLSIWDDHQLISGVRSIDEGFGLVNIMHHSSP